ncbi:hypothetical protein L210DRAFT_3574175 [Boletus edulis BED1]|uniref:Uncharacterized protein n=1 Tax=Boletus edulis BED1 TaxID=1328754 RepID=A0AAD4BDP9_BOLED|nr:hypothetical protein L210DRAFT_3574175 [Boletus edulis BED1]
MRTLLIPLRMATEARNLELVTYLVKIIDEVACCTSNGTTPVTHASLHLQRVPRPKAELEDAIEEVLVIPRNECKCPLKRKSCAHWSMARAVEYHSRDYTMIAIYRIPSNRTGASTRWERHGARC